MNGMMIRNPIYNLLLNTDSYKLSHFLQYPPHTEYISSYIESRGGRFDEVVFFGLQYFLRAYLSTPITLENIVEADQVARLHGLPFNRNGWEQILKKYDGRLPLRIEAVPEGTLIANRQVMLQVVNTDPEFFWLPSFIETALLRAIWYPSTVATLSREIKKIIFKYLEETADDTNGIDFKLHDFGARGVSSHESAGIGGLAHLVNFQGTDTLTAVMFARQYYHCEMAAYSIPASEHSTMTSWGIEAELNAYANMLDQFGADGSVFAVVSDSYDLWNALEHIWGDQLKDRVKNRSGVLVIRPDSGDPCETVLKTLTILMEKFGYSINTKGYKVLPDNIRIIQGDGVSLERIADILKVLKQHQISADNLAFGMGAELLQKVNRDTLKFAMKASAIFRDGMWHDIYKDPITDQGKRSKKGRLALIQTNDGYETIGFDHLGEQENILTPVYENGELLQECTLEQVRQRAKVE